MAYDKLTLALLVLAAVVWQKGGAEKVNPGFRTIITSAGLDYRKPIRVYNYNIQCT